MVKLRDRIDWLESERENQRDGQSSMWASGASGSVRGSDFFQGRRLGFPELEQPVHVDPDSSCSPNSRMSMHPEILVRDVFQTRCTGLDFVRRSWLVSVLVARDAMSATEK